jgi:TonB family protein
MTLAPRASRAPHSALWSLVVVVAPTIAVAPSTRAWAIEAPHAVGDVSSPPEILDRKDPAYPEARLTGDHGPDERLPELDVEIEVRLDEKGAVLSAVVLVSGGADFDEAALAATRSWTYKPAIRGGVAVPSTFHIPIHFEPPPHEEPTQVSIVGPKASAPRGAADFRVNLGELAIVPRKGAGDLLKLTPSVFLLRDGGGEELDMLFALNDARSGDERERCATSDGDFIGDLH